jgi:hypothetical protein
MMMRMTTLSLALVGLLAFAGHAHAQATSPSAPSFGETTPASAMLTEQTVDTFVDAFVAVQEVREDFAERLGSATNEGEAQTMQQQAQENMLRAVEQTGMSVQEYNDVATALQNDPELLQQVRQMAEERM